MKGGDIMRYVKPKYIKVSEEKLKETLSAGACSWAWACAAAFGCPIGYFCSTGF